MRARVAAWQLLRVAEEVGKELTMAQLCDLARGLGGGGGKDKDTDAAKGKSKGKGRARGKEKASVDVHEVAGGKVELSREVRVYVCVALAAVAGVASWMRVVGCLDEPDPALLRWIW